MGFTKTSEGRVFFKNADNDDAPTTVKKAKANPPILPADNTQVQILLLLKSLNTKLKSSKIDKGAITKELKQYKDTIKNLEEKTSEQEKNYIDLEQKISTKQNEASKKATRVENSVKNTLKQLEEAKKLVLELETKNSGRDETLEELKEKIAEQQQKDEAIIKRQKALATMQKQQGEKMVDNVAAYVAITKRVSESEARNEALDNKIEDAKSEYIKLDRKIDKAIEDRNRILRKVDRIEQAVLETRDALNAKAMVLLTDQGAVAGVNMPQITDKVTQTDPIALNKRLQEEALMPWWRRPVRIQATSLILMMIVVLLLGWIISGAIKPPAPTIVKLGNEATPPIISLNQSYEDIEPMAGTSPVEDIYAQDDFSNYEEHAPINDNVANDNIKTLDINNDAQMIKAFEEDPNLVAQRLNQIEPSSLTTQDKIEPVKKAAIPAVKAIVKTPEITRNNDQYIKALKARIKPDPNLTDIAKKIENQAFQGVGEAQHDMGAIYVAGHGQIKQDMKRAALWFNEAAQNGISNAKYNLGVLYHQGLGVKQDIPKAMALYEEAAALGHPEAGYNLGIANIEGIGVPYNPARAANFFEAAANKGVVEAAYNLGLIYENGLLGETSPNNALAWYKAAADEGSKEASAALKQLAKALGISVDDVDIIIESLPKTQNNSDRQGYIISNIQKELMNKGLYSGAIDGMNGPMTRNAIKKFQQSMDLEVNGTASQELLNYLQNTYAYR